MTLKEDIKKMEEEEQDAKDRTIYDMGKRIEELLEDNKKLKDKVSRFVNFLHECNDTVCRLKIKQFFEEFGMPFKIISKEDD